MKIMTDNQNNPAISTVVKNGVVEQTPSQMKVQLESKELLRKKQSLDTQNPNTSECCCHDDRLNQENSNEKTYDEEIVERELQQKSSSQCSIMCVDSKHGETDSMDEKSYCDSVSLSEPCCRVCQCNGNEEKLISPCLCSGSVKWIHESCLIQWMKSSLKESCELCTKKIKITKRRKPLSKWKLPSQRPTPVLWVLVFITAIALNMASVVKDASRLCKSTPCIVFYAVGCIGVILGTLFLIYWSKRARVFLNHWMELNEEWVVITDQQHSDRRVVCNTNSVEPKKLIRSCSITVTT